MTQLTTEHAHPISGITIRGFRLQPGATLEENDHYDSTSGAWEPNPCSTIKLREGSTAIWIRPSINLSQPARDLLARLTACHPGAYSYVKRSRGQWYNVPSYNYNWDGRVSMYEVEARAVEELLAHSLLRYKEFDEVAILTEPGVQFGMKVLEESN